MNGGDDKIPIGIQTFDKIIEGGYIYVDKTEYIYDIAHKFNYVFLSRPRRFGKSLLSSTFQAYFSGRKDLFNNLKAGNLETASRPLFRHVHSKAHDGSSST